MRALALLCLLPALAFGQAESIFCQTPSAACWASAFLASDGSATSGGYGFQGADEYIYRTSNNRINFAINGAQSISILSGGAITGTSSSALFTLTATSLLEGQSHIIRNNLSSGVSLTIDGASGQTANLFEAKVNGGSALAKIAVDGYFASVTPEVLNFYLNAQPAAGATTYGGHVLSAKAFTVKAVSFRTTGAVSAGAGVTDIRISDGTNNCEASFDCTTTGLLGTADNGNKRDESLTGTCTFAASASLTFSVQQSTCATTRPTILGTVSVEGWHQ